MEELEGLRVLVLELQEKVLILEDKVTELEGANTASIPVKLDTLGG